MLSGRGAALSLDDEDILGQRLATVVESRGGRGRESCTESNSLLRSSTSLVLALTLTGTPVQVRPQPEEPGVAGDE